MSAKSLREDAENCLRLAAGTQAPDVAEELRLMAADYLERAAKLGQGQQQHQIQPKSDEE